MIKAEADNLEGQDTTKGVLINEQAKAATEREHSLTLRQALKKYPAAVFWSFVFCLTIVMEGYDTILMGSFFAYPSFQKKYGEPLGDGYTISGPWQAGLSNGVSCGTFIGVLANGWLTERFGHRRVIMVSLIFLTGFIFITFFAPNLTVLEVGQLLGAVPLGIFAIMGPTYASEVCPLALRGYLTAYVNMCWGFGQIVAGGVLEGLVNDKSEWGYRIPFALQWMWPVPLFILTYLAPDSPWWLVRKGRVEEAEISVKRLSSKEEEMDVSQMVAMMVHTNNLEKAMQTESSYWDCFKGTNLRRTEIACGALAGQIFTGLQFAYSPTYFFSLAGINPDQDYKLSLSGFAISIIGCGGSWILLNKFGRRTIYLSGFVILMCLLLIIGGLSYPAESNNSVKYGQAALTLVWIAVYSTTNGPVAFTIGSEVSATRLRAQTLGLARACYYIFSIVANVVEPYLIAPTEANLKGKTAFFWFAMAFIGSVWTFFRLPETKGRTYEELDLMFERRLSPWKFKGYKIDAYEDVVV